MPKLARSVIHLSLQKDLILKIDRMRRPSGLTRVAFIRWMLHRAVNAVTDPGVGK